ncbi:MAG: N-acetyltransferase family protein [Thermoleophilia bacterium]|nr:N-acetyltransferase family protein [Thermoleophilia bacterium]
MTPAVPVARWSNLTSVPPRECVIRRAGAPDAGSIGAIYDEAIASGVATFAAGPHDARERRIWLAARGDRSPVWVLDKDDTILGWSAVAPFSHRPWYDGVAEYTVYIAAAAQGCGHGGAMLDHLITTAPEFGYWKLVGMILDGNTGGIALARGHGFREVGTHQAHGRVSGTWRDVTVMEIHLGNPT